MTMKAAAMIGGLIGFSIIAAAQLYLYSTPFQTCVRNMLASKTLNSRMVAEDVCMKLVK